METIPSVLIDPFILIFPHHFNRAEDVESYAEGLLGWAEAFLDRRVNYYVSSSYIEGMLKDGVYPLSKHLLHKAITSLGIEHLDASKICELLNVILETALRVEDSSMIEDAVFDIKLLAPEQFIERLPVETRNQTSKCLTIFASWCRIRSESLPVVVGTRNDARCVTPSELRFEADVQVIQTSSDAYSNDPFTVKCSWKLVGSYDDLCDGMSAVAIWDDDDEVRARTAIEAKLRQLIASGATASDHPSFLFGSDFLPSVKRWNFSSRQDLLSVLIDSCAKLMTATPKGIVKEFTSGIGGPQWIRTDGATAWRVHLTKHGAGFRLMFWILKDGSIEFANVGDKDELKIS